MTGVDRRSSVFLRPRPVGEPAVRLIGFHHAGGSAAVYYPVVRGLPADWDLLLMDLPGRGRRAGETQLEDMDAVVARAVADVLPWTGDAPFALFGHSMGAIVAFETARALEAAGRRPVWTGVSGRAAPRYRGERRPALSGLGDDALLQAMLELGGMPEGVTEATDFLARFLVTVRRDLRAVDGYRPAAGREPLDCPLTVFGGTRDSWAPASAMHLWRHETRSRFAQKFFPGDHFYFLGAGFPELTRQLVGQVAACLAASAPQAA